jgi:hypothetical protein
LNNENTIKKITPLARFLQLVPIIPRACSSITPTGASQ